MNELIRKLVVLDLDGTLVDSCQDLATAVNLMRQHYGFPPLALETVKRYVGNGVRMLVSRSLEGTGIDTDEALKIQVPLYRTHLTDQTVLYPGVREGLTELKRRGHVLAVATNKPAEACEIILNHFGIRGLFIDVLAGGTFPVLKPAPDMLFAIMKTAGIGPGDTWMVGDNYTDLEAARRASVNSIFLTYGYGGMGTETATVECDSFYQVTEFLMRF